ncbi:620_t:CDS:2 [Acaulospora colombiana]|uniref:620_t:CDS:1 n=1 Tax=Acaulospora colombiana TaxID=27376 RepID=A0ACA9MTI1_9GLOM|nr:620_t:CDS:2 [Acaulospora colombiana]
MTSNLQIITLPNTLATTPLDEILQGLCQPTGQKSLPTILLYDELGLRLYDDITTKASEYYLFPAEEQILRDNGASIIRMMHGGSPVHPGEVVLELGAGALRKTSLLLRSLANVSPKSDPPAVTYLALDLERRELDRTLSSIASSEIGPLLVDRVRIGGLCGTYDDGIAYVRGGGLSEMYSSPLLSPSSLKSGVADNGDNSTVNAQVASALNDKDAGHFPTLNSLEATSAGRQDSLPSPAESDEHDIDRPSSPLTFTETQSSYSTDYDETPPLHLLFLGSSIGNFTREGAADFLRSLPLRSWTGGPDSISGRPLGDTLLLGLDHDNEPERIERAYNDPAGYTRKFIMNGLAGVRRAFEQAGYPKETVSAFDEQNWEYQEQYNTTESMTDLSWRWNQEELTFI